MPKARFENIYQDLKAKVLDGTYGYQSFLPPETELTASYTCSRNTRRASPCFPMRRIFNLSMVGVSELFGKSKLMTFLDLLRVLNPSRNMRSVTALFPYRG